MLRGSASPSHLADLTGLSTGSTTAMIDRLEQKGLVERHPTPEDRRGTTIVLTKEAMRKLPTLLSRWPKLWKHWSRVTPKRSSKSYRISSEKSSFSGRRSASDFSHVMTEKKGAKHSTVVSLCRLHFMGFGVSIDALVFFDNRTDWNAGGDG